jgi:PncC family amidohydrolase
MKNTSSIFDTAAVERIKDKLLETDKRMAVAESVTAGFLQAAIASATNASNFFQGGITVYNGAQKFKHLQVEPIHAQHCNCVSGKVAAQMALHVCTLFASDYGIGITGFASPVAESNQQLFAYYAIAENGNIVGQEKLTATADNPQEVQLYYVNAVLDKLATLLHAAV